MGSEQPNVYFISLTSDSDVSTTREKIAELCSRAGFPDFVASGETVALKTHFGEAGNRTHLRPHHIRPVVDLIKKSGGKPYLTETSVLYKSRRSNALDHILLAYEHGFTFEATGAPIIMSDGFLGNWERQVAINGEYYREVSVSGDSLSPDRLFIISHMTGHLLSGFGAALKNLGMGLSSRKGKLNQHSGVAPRITKACILCGACIKWCPEEAVIEKEKKAFIIKEKCIGCGECIAVCKPGAVAFSWDASSEDMQKKMVEHAYGIFLERKGRMAFINFLISMTRDCDCMSSDDTIIKDIGVLASFDPVAIDRASLDLTVQGDGRNLSNISYPPHDPLIQIRYAEKLGMGKQDYRLINIE